MHFQYFEGEKIQYNLLKKGVLAITIISIIIVIIITIIAITYLGGLTTAAMPFQVVIYENVDE